MIRRVTTGLAGFVALAAVGATTGGLTFVHRPSFVDAGEVYRVWLDGRRVDLSHSAAAESFPLVSPDGRQVAFLRDEAFGSGHPSYVLYVVGVDGHRLRRVASLLTDQNLGGELAWSPDSRRIAVGLPRSSGGDGLAIFDPARRRRIGSANLPRFSNPLPAWSPDGRLVAVNVAATFARGGYDPSASSTAVFTAGGKLVWRHRGTRWSPTGQGAWSARGELAVIWKRMVRVYDETGRLRMTFPGVSYAWSPDGKRLASQTSGRLEIRSLSGRLLFRKALPHLLRRGNPIIWRDRSHVLVLVSRGTATLPPISVDLARGTLATLATANDFYTGIPTGEVSPSRRFTAGFAVTTGAHWALVVRRPDGSLRATLTKPRVCPDAIEVDIQWLPDSESLVYDIRCES